MPVMFDARGSRAGGDYQDQAEACGRDGLFIVALLDRSTG